jgi:hypothetical protein
MTGKLTEKPKQIRKTNPGGGTTGAWLFDILTALCAVIALSIAVMVLIRFQFYYGFLVIGVVFILIAIQVRILKKSMRN